MYETGEGSDAGCSTDKHAMQTPDGSLPWIFLSHSGQQKGNFVTHLYHALLHANHRPFFDKDSIQSLPVGLDYPPRIFEACKACEIGVVVLSDGYVKTLWPMLELQHLLRFDRRIYPLFYDLQPADLSSPANLERWKECWALQAAQWQSRMGELQAFMSSSGYDVQINLDIDSWPENLKKLQYRSGEVRNVIYVNRERALYQSDREYIDAVVSNICAALPPPKKYSLDIGIKGGERMQQEIDAVFQQESIMGDDGVCVIGVHGIGGSGKSTLCKLMVNFYTNTFPGRCSYLEFPSNGHGTMNLLDSIKSILPSLSIATQDVTNIDQMDMQIEICEKSYF